MKSIHGKTLWRNQLISSIKIHKKLHPWAKITKLVFLKNSKGNKTLLAFVLASLNVAKFVWSEIRHMVELPNTWELRLFSSRDKGCPLWVSYFLQSIHLKLYLEKNLFLPLKWSKNINLYLSKILEKYPWRSWFLVKLKAWSLQHYWKNFLRSIFQDFDYFSDTHPSWKN